ATVALVGNNGKIEPGSLKSVLFGGRASTVIPAGAPFLSDPVDLTVPPLATLSISVYVPQSTGPCTCHSVARETVGVSGRGNFTRQAFQPRTTLQSFAFISGVELESAVPAKAIVALGDSITDGVGSTPGANRRWPDLLADRLERRGHDPQWGVVNMGISGNRVLDDGAGQSALARFDRDVLSVPGAAYVIVFEGVNDLGISYGHFAGPLAKMFASLAPAHKATAARMIEGYRQIIARAHLDGLKVIGATITPYGGSGYYSKQGNAVREAINHWIRTSGAFDGVIDFDAVMRDKKDPTRIAAPLQAGDHLHGSDAGYEAMTKSIALSLFK
ncbi:MAG: SGNH/GDSL hydrolase family protein, partial [Steroidobacteraceae bacterium]